MTVKYIFFYANPTDVVPLLQNFEENAPLKFGPTERSLSPNRAIYLKSSAIPNPGLDFGTSGLVCPVYMVSLRDSKNHLYSLKCNDGLTRWALLNGDNEDAVLLKLGGLTRSGALLEGEMTTLHGTNAAQQLMRWFLSALKDRGFKRLQGCWVGQAAFEMLKTGRRLTQAEQAPETADLKWPGA